MYKFLRFLLFTYGNLPVRGVVFEYCDEKYVSFHDKDPSHNMYLFFLTTKVKYWDDSVSVQDIRSLRLVVKGFDRSQSLRRELMKGRHDIFKLLY